MGILLVHGLFGPFPKQLPKDLLEKKEAGPMTITKVLNRGWTAFATGRRRGLLPVFGAFGA